MDPLSIYSRKAKDYDLYRPDYVSEAFEQIFDTTKLYSHWTVADIGSGTGKVSKHFVDHVNTLYAVEPNQAMRERALLLLNNHKSFKSVKGTAEKTSLVSKSVDMITVGQATHWFHHDLVVAEFSRILKQGGWLAIIWNEFGGRQNLNIEPFFMESNYTIFSYPQTIHETWEQYIGGVRSSATAPDQEDIEYEAYEKAHQRIFNSRATGGVIKVNFTTILILGHMNCSLSTINSPVNSLHVDVKKV